MLVTVTGAKKKRRGTVAHAAKSRDKNRPDPRGNAIMGTGKVCGESDSDDPDDSRSDSRASKVHPEKERRKRGNDRGEIEEKWMKEDKDQPKEEQETYEQRQGRLALAEESEWTLLACMDAVRERWKKGCGKDPAADPPLFITQTIEGLDNVGGKEDSGSALPVFHPYCRSWQHS